MSSDPQAAGHQDFAPSFEQILAGLVLGEAPVAALVALAEDAAVLSLEDGSHAFVFRSLPDGMDRLREQLRRAVEALKAGRAFLVVVGGPASVQHALKHVQPFWMIRRHVGVLQVKQDGGLHVGDHTPSHNSFVRRLKKLAGEPGPDAADLRGALEEAVDPASDRVRELASFGVRMRRVRPWATWSVLLVCLVFMALETWWGGSTFIPTLVRMGANVPVRVQEGEWYRLIGCLFLHGGIEHILGNMLVLFYLGAFVERLLGTARFVILYVLSGVAGSLMSALMSDAVVSVGASSALWGMLGASAAIAFRPAGLLPAPLLIRLKRVAVVNLGLNVLVSMLPQIDLWAHLGGGLTGVLLVGSGLLTRGLTDAGPVRDRRTGALAMALGLLLVAGSGWGVSTGQAWQLAGDLSWRRVELGDAGITLEVPALVADKRQRIGAGKPGGGEFVFGRFEEDPFIIGVKITSAAGFLGDAGTLDEGWAFVTRMRQAAVPEGFTRVGEVTDTSMAGTRTLKDVLVLPNGGRLTRFLQLRPAYSINIEVLVWPETPGHLLPDVERVVVSQSLDDRSR